ncbi:hypothetical protein KAW48_07715, partial [candidate division WOR-3 bacterium]|nr:hypothetical protein [candidate division WOR-3 bacterium]
TITGKKPFGGSLQKIVHSKLVEDLVQPSQLNPSIPEDLDGLIQRMVSRRLDWRLKKVSDVWRQLEIGSSGSVVSVSFLPVFVGRKEELKYFDEMMNRLPESHILWVVGDMGMGKTQFLNRCRTKGLMKGLSVKELSCGELYKLLEKGEFPGEPIILLVDEPERVETLPVTLKQNIATIRHNPLIILITSEKKPEETPELSDITTFLSLSPLNKKEIRDICDRNFPKLKNRDALISFITERTNGIPLLINQTLRYLSDERIIGRKGEEWVFKEEEARNIPFSPDIKELLKFQVENLSQDERNLLRMCSVFINRIPLSFLQGLRIKNPYSIIESLVIKRLLVKNEGIIQFSNKWIQELLYQSLKKEEKKRIYKEIIKGERITEPEVLYPLQIEL